MSGFQGEVGEGSIRLKCVHSITGTTMLVVLNPPVSFKDLAEQVEQEFGNVEIVFKTKNDNDMIVTSHDVLMEAISVYLSGPRRSSMRLTIRPPQQTKQKLVSGKAISPKPSRNRNTKGKASKDHDRVRQSPPSPPPGIFKSEALTEPMPIPSASTHRRTNSGSFVTRKEGGAFIPEDEGDGYQSGRSDSISSNTSIGLSLSNSFSGFANADYKGDSFSSRSDLSGSRSFTKLHSLSSSNEGETRSERAHSSASLEGEHVQPNTFPRAVNATRTVSAQPFSTSSFPGRIRTQSSSRPRSRHDLAGGDSDEARDMLGRRVGSNANFKIPKAWQKGKHLGSGAFGQVYLAYGTDTGMEFAVKQVMLKSESGKDNLKEIHALNQEIKMLQNLRHERIVTYYGTKQTSEYLAIFMEYVPGRSIHTRLTEYGAFEDKLIRKYTKQVLEGIIYLHDNSIIHRDIKGANVLADSAGNVKLADFGASKKIGMQSMKGWNSVHGTPYWMSPEAVNPNGGGHTFKSDIWSIAALVVEMLTTHPPYWEFEPMTALFKLGHIENISLKDLIPQRAHVDAKRFLERCFQTNQNLRPDAVVLIHDRYLTE